MKTLAITTGVALVAVGYFIPGFAATFQTPPQLHVHPLTEEDVKNEFMTEQYAHAEELARKVYERHGCNNDDLIWSTAVTAVDKNLPPRILAALIFVESSCRARLVTRVDGKITACGLTQVNPTIWNISCEDLMDPDTAMDQGSDILASYKARYGLREGLHHYLGMGHDDGQLTGDEYVARVMTVAGYHVN